MVFCSADASVALRSRKRRTRISEFWSYPGWPLWYTTCDTRSQLGSRRPRAAMWWLAAILGHANLRTVMRYVHLSREHRRTQMRRFVEAEEIRSGQNRVKSGSNVSAEMTKSEQTSANEILPINHIIQ